MRGDDELPPVRGVPTNLRGPRSLESQEKLTGPSAGPSVRPSLEASAALGQPSDGTLTFLRCWVESRHVGITAAVATRVGYTSGLLYGFSFRTIYSELLYSSPVYIYGASCPSS
jgi:hypothetical protein